MSDLLFLCYHAVSERWPATLAVTPDELEHHASWLTRRGYRGVTFHQAVVDPPAARAVVITFDDAFRSVIDRALPILAQAGLPATVFAPSDFIGHEQPMFWPGVEQWLSTEHRDELVAMGWEDLDRLADSGWEIGSHGRSHRRLTELDRVALDADLRGSRAEIERRLGRPCRSLAYPYGVRDRRVIESARRAGYAAAAGTRPLRVRPPTDPLDCSRIVVNRGDGARRFRLKVSPLVRRLRANRAADGLLGARRRGRGSAA